MRLHLLSPLSSQGLELFGLAQFFPFAQSLLVAVYFFFRLALLILVLVFYRSQYGLFTIFIASFDSLGLFSIPSVPLVISLTGLVLKRKISLVDFVRLKMFFPFCFFFLLFSRTCWIKTFISINFHVNFAFSFFVPIF